MAFLFNGVAPEKIVYNSVNVEKVVHNGVVVWESWKDVAKDRISINLAGDRYKDILNYPVEISRTSGGHSAEIRLRIAKDRNNNKLSTTKLTATVYMMYYGKIDILVSGKNTILKLKDQTYTGDIINKNNIYTSSGKFPIEITTNFIGSELRFTIAAKKTEAYTNVGLALENIKIIEKNL